MVGSAIEGGLSECLADSRTDGSGMSNLVQKLLTGIQEKVKDFSELSVVAQGSPQLSATDNYANEYVSKE